MCWWAGCALARALHVPLAACGHTVDEVAAAPSATCPAIEEVRGFGCLVAYLTEQLTTVRFARGALRVPLLTGSLIACCVPGCQVVCTCSASSGGTPSFSLSLTLRLMPVCFALHMFVSLTVSVYH